MKKNTAVLLHPGEAILVDFERDFEEIGRATQNDDGLFHLSDQQTEMPTSSERTSTKTVSEMMKTAKRIFEVASAAGRRLGNCKTEDEENSYSSTGSQTERIDPSKKEEARNEKDSVK